MYSAPRSCLCSSPPWLEPATTSSLSLSLLSFSPLSGNSTPSESSSEWNTFFHLLNGPPNLHKISYLETLSPQAMRNRIGKEDPFSDISYPISHGLRCPNSLGNTQNVQKKVESGCTLQIVNVSFTDAAPSSLQQFSSTQQALPWTVTRADRCTRASEVVTGFVRCCWARSCYPRWFVAWPSSSTSSPSTTTHPGPFHSLSWQVFRDFCIPRPFSALL